MGAVQQRLLTLMAANLDSEQHSEQFLAIPDYKLEDRALYRTIEFALGVRSTVDAESSLF